MADDRQTISSSRLSAADVARHSFGTVRRGFDPAEVRTFLEAVGRELSTWEQRELELRREVSAAEERALHPVIDEATLMSSLGQQSAQVLRKAHEQSDAIVLEAEERAAVLRHEAQQHVVTAEVSAGERIAEAELAIATLRQQLEVETAARHSTDNVAREELLARTREEGRAIIEEAQVARKRVLADLAQRRRTLHHQIEQFRAAHDELAAAVLNVRGSVDQIVGDLARADDDARSAAAEVRSRQSTEDPEVDDPDLELAATEIAAVGLPDGGASDGGALGGSDGDDASADSPDVEGLFARLRASTPEGAGTPDVPSRPPPPPPKAARASATGTATAVVTEPAAEPDEAADGSVDESVDGSLDESADGLADGFADGPSGVNSEDAAWLDRRAVLLDPVTAQLGKRLKRALQDDQNQLLNQIRAAKGTWSDEMLPAVSEHQARYLTAASAQLREAWGAGDRFARAELESAGGVGPNASGAADAGDGTAVDRLSTELSINVVTLLRRRLAGSESPDGEEAVERVGAAYREWRGERIERLVGDFSVAAFSAGTLAGLRAAGGAGKPVGARWVLAASDGACADCDDNSLAGAVGSGEEFPTGHLHPPAHGGCRCLVIPTLG